MSREHHVIVVPGLGNDVQKHVWATNGWKRYGVIPHIFDARWKIEEPALQPKLDGAIDLVDLLLSQGKTVSLVGNSAGSSFVLNIFGARVNKIRRVVINCGRVRSGDWPWFTFQQATAVSPSFKDSVVRAEILIPKISRTDRQRILTLRPLFDEVVPPFTVQIRGATNEISPSVEHVLSIGLNMTLMSGRIIKFLRE